MLPELEDVSRLYAVTGVSRKDILKMNLLFKRPIRKYFIVFYGGTKSGSIRNTRTLRYRCGLRQSVIAQLNYIEFKTWMDYRLYEAIMNEDYTYCRIGRRCDFSAEKLLSMATRIRSRKRSKITRDMKIYAKSISGTKKERERRKKVKASVDEKVSNFIQSMVDSGFIKGG